MPLGARYFFVHRQIPHLPTVHRGGLTRRLGVTAPAVHPMLYPEIVRTATALVAAPQGTSIRPKPGVSSALTT